MSWTEMGFAIDVGGGAGATPTSTSTVLGDDASGDVLLRMFGVDAGQLSALGTVAEVQGSRPADCGEVVQGTGNIGYIESTAAPASSATAADLLFEPSLATGPPLHLTVVPNKKDGLVLETGSGSSEPAYVVYKDCHVLELPDGLGWLMCLGRYHRKTADGRLGPGFDDPSPTNCLSAIVGFWAPASDPTFTGAGVKGPYWLVGRWHDVDGVRVPLWLGVPAAAVVEQGGLDYLYVYYTAESTSYGLGSATAADPSVAGTWLRKIPLTSLLAVASVGSSEVSSEALWRWALGVKLSRFKKHIEGASEILTIGRTSGASFATISAQLARYELDWVSRSAGGVPWTDPSFTDEASWNSEIDAWLLPGGVQAGKVRVWVATGTEFVSGADPASDAQGNTPIEDAYAQLKVVDAVPVVDGSELVIFFSGNRFDDGSTGTYAWGIWRATALDPSIGEHGLDFAVDDDTSDRVLESASDDEMKLDPDPVALPDGTWVVFAGQPNAELLRVEGDAADVFVPAEDAWR